MTGSATVMQDAGFQPPTELVPTNLEQEVRELEALIEKWKTEGYTPTEVLHKLEIEIEQKLSEDHSKPNSAGIYFTPQAYFECVGLAPTGSAPNANC